MTLSGLLVFAAAYALAVASPGPGVAAAVARGLGRGRQGAVPFIAGYVVGDLVWFTVATAGLSFVAELLGPLFAVIRYAGAAYLLFLAWKLWTTPVTPSDAAALAERPPEGGWSLFLGSLSLTLGNPKPILFFMALLPSIVDLHALTLLGFVEVAALMVVLLSAIIGSYVLLAASARRFFTSARAMRRLNRVTGTVMAGAAVAVATR
jgi:threonine/homoserine/homoserine lactone efflux protein